jgi:hypothetical protein
MRTLGGAYARLKRVDQNTDSLNKWQAKLVEENKDRLRFYVDPESGVAMRWEAGKNIIAEEPEVSIIVGEAVYNLRAALDYLVYELAALDSKSIQENTQFPICDTERKFDDARKRHLAGVSSQHVLAIEEYQPYRNCQWTRTLRDISNPDKHRELTLCEERMSGDFTIRVGTPERIEWDASNNTVPTSVPVGGTIDVGANEHVRIEGLISLYIEFADGLRVIDTLKELKASVAALLDRFDPEFRAANT